MIKSHLSKLVLAIVLFASFLLTKSTQAQNFSTKGKDFWVGYMYNYDGAPVSLALSVYVSSQVNTSGTIDIPGVGLQAFSVTAGSTTKINIPSSLMAAKPTSFDTTETKGIHIMVNDSSNVFALNYAKESADAIVVFPTEALGNLYYITTHSQDLLSFDSEVMVLATENNTAVEVYNQYTGFFKTVYLNKGQTYLYREQTSDQTGTRIKSVSYLGKCKKIAVFAGNECTTVGNGMACDHLFEQMYPVDTWGYNFITAPYKTRSQDMFKVVASQNNTNIYVDGVLASTRMEGQIYKFNSGTAKYISSDKPVSVTQFSRSRNTDNVTDSDPFMIVVSPVEQTLKKLTFNAYTSTVITAYYLNIITKTANTGLVKLDGATVGSGSFTTVAGNTNYSYAQLTISQGNHTVESDSGLIANVYGYGPFESYGYAAGASLRNLSSFTTSAGPYCASTNITFTSYPPDPTISTWSWNFGDGGATATTSSVSHAYSAPGTYTVSMIIQKSNKCDKDTIRQSITIGGTSATVTSTSGGVCLGNATSFTSTPNGPVISYNWNFGDASSSTVQNPTHTYASAGTQTVTVNIVATDGCPATYTINPVVKPIPVAGFTAPAACLGSVNTFTDGSTNSPNGWSWDFGDASTATTQNPSHTYASAGPYTVTLTASVNGCTASTTKSVTVNSLPTSAITSTVGANCKYSSTGQATSTAGAGYSYSWSTSPSQTTITATGLNAANTYTVKVTDGNGCTSTATATVTEPATGVLTSVVNGSVVNVMCKDPLTGIATGSAEVTANGTGTSPYTFSWSNGVTDATATNLTVASGTSQTYTVTITDANNCSSSATVQITQPSTALTASIVSSSFVNCYSNSTGAATVSAASSGTSPYAYSWNTTPSQSIAAATGLPAGTYTVLVTDANACTKTQSVIITEPIASLTSAIAPSDNHSVLCNGGSTGSATVTVQGGTTAYSYTWSNSSGVMAGQTAAAATNLAAGSYTVNITDFNGCTSSATVTVTEPPVLSLSGVPVANNAHCNQSDGDATVVFQGGTAPLNYLWSPSNQTTSNATGLASNIYTVTVTDAKNCTINSTVSIANIGAPLLTESFSDHTNVLCRGNVTGTAGVLISSSQAGIPPYTYTWTTSPTQTTAIATGLSAGTYTVVVNDNVNCSAQQIVTITQPSSDLTATISASQFVNCFGNSTGSATVNMNNTGTPGYNYSWNTSPAQTTVSATGLAQGVYTVNVIDGNGCTASQSVTITQPNAALALAIDTSLYVKCFGNNTGFAIAAASNGTGPYTYLWSNNDADSVAQNLATGNYTVVVTDFNGCTQSTSISISQPTTALVASTAGGVMNALCYKDSSGQVTVNVNNTGTSPYTYVWTNTSQTTSSITGLKANTYEVIVTDANGCTTTTSALVDQPSAALIANPAVNPAVCYGENTGSASVAPSGGTTSYSFSWSTGSTSSAINGLTAGTYTVLVTDKNNCTATASVDVTQPQYPLDAQFTATPTSGVEPVVVTFTNNSTGASWYSWNFGDGAYSVDSNPIHTFDSAGTYTVMLVASLNTQCFDTLYTEIVVKEKYDILFPNVFTPNTDGKNDQFRVKTSGITDIEVTIYDRWGLEMAKWQGLVGYWDGRAPSGGQAPDGTYYYIAKATDLDGVKHDYQGYIQLIR